MDKSKDLEGVSIVQQLRLALKMLNGHPGIESVIDLKAARKFLDMLDTTTAAYIPDFSKVDTSKVQVIKKEIEGKLEDWHESLKTLPGDVIIFEDLEDDEIIYCHYPTNLKEFISHGVNCSLSSSIKFLIGNKAIILNLWNEEKKEYEDHKGTWEDIYIKLANHLNALASKAKIPHLPATLVSA